MPLDIIRNDITRVPADAIVNTANPHVAIGAGTDQAIYEAAGREQLLAERAKIGEMRPGQAAYTPAFALPAKHIIHSVGPAWHGGGQHEREILAQCYRSCLSLADELGCETVAFPLLSSGSYGFPKDEALKIAISEISSFLFEHDMNVLLVVYDKESFVVSGRAFSNVKSFIAENEVRTYAGRSNQARGHLLAEYEASRIDKSSMLPQADLSPEEESYMLPQAGASPEEESSMLPQAGVSSEEESSMLPQAGASPEEESYMLRSPDSARVKKKSGLRGMLRRHDTGAFDLFDRVDENEGISFRREELAEDLAKSPMEELAEDLTKSPLEELAEDLTEYHSRDLAEQRAAGAPYSGYREISLDDIFKMKGETFQQVLFKIIDRKGLTDPEVYKKANIDRKLFSKIRSNVDYMPSKSTALALIIGLELNIDEATDLLQRAGYSFSPSSVSDLTVQSCIMQQMYDIHTINCYLFEFGQKTLG